MKSLFLTLFVSATALAATPEQVCDALHAYPNYAGALQCLEDITNP